MLIWIGISLLLLAVAIAAYVFDAGDLKRYADDAQRIRAAIQHDADTRVYEARIERDKARGF